MFELKGSLNHSAISCESAAMSALPSGAVSAVCHEAQAHVQILVPA